MLIVPKQRNQFLVFSHTSGKSFRVLKKGLMPSLSVEYTYIQEFVLI